MHYERLLAAASSQKTDNMMKDLMTMEATRPLLERLKKMEQELSANIKAASEPSADVMASAYTRLDTLRKMIKQIEETNSAIELSVEDYVQVN